MIDGVCPPSLAKRKVAGICHARWLTTAIRINFLYMSMPTPSAELTRLATFVVTVYACLWFQSKLNWRATDAPKIIFNAMKLIYALPAKERNVLIPVFQRSFYWGHQEQILPACLADPDPDIRAFGISKIIKARYDETQRKGISGGKAKRGNLRGERGALKGVATVREFKIPMPIYTATHYSTMIDWDSEIVASPPCLRKFSDEDIRKFQENPLCLDVPNNAQHVERFIRLMAENATRASTAKRRDGLCKATIRNRAKRPKIEGKKDFE